MNAIILDTETANTIEDPTVFNIGWAVLDLDTEEVLKTESFVVAEIFRDPDLMSSSYYAEKIPAYLEDIENGKIKLARMKTIQKIFYQDYYEYGVTEIYAHNARFDYRSCTCTRRWMTSSKERYFFPYGAKICDTLKMARQMMKGNEDYTNFCKEHGYRTKNNQNRLTAEVLYRYLTKDTDFNEEHRAIEDVMIEKEILFACRKNGILDGALWE